MKISTLILACSLFCAGAAPLVHAQEMEPPCGSLKNPYGPFDYRKERGRALEIVDAKHFTLAVEYLRAGESGYLGGDLDYTLRASPNHHRALMSLANWGVKLKGQQPPHLPRTVECYFERALRFQPDDHIPRMILVDYFGRLQRKADALAVAEPLLKAETLDSFTHNNLGLLMFDLGEYDKALEQSHRAIAQGWQRNDLVNRLKSVGRWRDPVATVPAADAASAPASASSR